jgi:hypothetical protein
MALMLLASLRLIMSVIASGYKVIKIIKTSFLRCANFSFSASRKFHRKTLLYVSGLGMMISIFIAALLVQNMEGSASTSNFLSNPKVKQTIENERESFDEVYLLVSILVYNSFSALGVLILPWTLITELYPIQVTKHLKIF